MSVLPVPASLVQHSGADTSMRNRSGAAPQELQQATCVKALKRANTRLTGRADEHGEPRLQAGQHGLRLDGRKAHGVLSRLILWVWPGIGGYVRLRSIWEKTGGQSQALRTHTRRGAVWRSRQTDAGFSGFQYLRFFRSRRHARASDRCCRL